MVAKTCGRGLLRVKKSVIWGIALAVGMSGLLTGCRSRDAKSHAIVTLFDTSDSTINTRERYQREFEEKVLKALQGGETLIVDLITENTLATSYPIEVEFPKFDPTRDNRLMHQQKMQQLKEKVKQELRTLLQRQSPRTDLLNAFVAAAKVLNGDRCKHASDKILIVFSDMIEQSARYDFTGMKLTERQIRQLIETLQKTDRLPDLKGVKVWIVGATAAEQGGLPPEKIYEIEKFWMEYFKACGADLTRERYATSLVGFELER